MYNRYPLWKNLLLVFLLVIAIIYAAPNLFGSDPAVQISASDTAIVTSNIEKRIKEIFNKQQLQYLKIEHHKDSLLIRFSDPDIQIKARDIIKASLGDDYVVALNLATRNPKWLSALGANPMKLGLDLCGGVHFLLAVDLSDMIKKREDGDLRSIINDLRELGIRYLSIERIQPHGISIAFRDVENFAKGQTELKRRLPDYLFTKITTDDVIKLQVMMSEQAVFKVADYAIDQTVNTLRNRVNELGVSEAIVQRQGANHVSVDLPGIQDTTRAKELIGKTATLRFHMVDVEAAMSGDVPIGTKLYEYEGRKLLLKDQVVLQGNSITYSDARFSQDGRLAVNVHLGGGGESTFHRVTAENVGKPMAVVYVEIKSEQQVVDGKIVTVNHPIERVISVATIQTALGNNFEITGLKSEKYAQDLSLLLRSGALVAPVTFAEELTVGPSMGKANINKGILSIVVGYIFVILFMAFYYRFFGLIANVALLLNLVFVSAILSILGAVLTLPGMAGMVLTVGLAVDACVLIYERIREELRRGVSPQASIYTGYDHAITTIIDANVATLIVAMVLYALGTGAVKGFAVVLTIGLMTSMLTSVVFTRAIVNWIYGGKSVKKLSIGI
ncbi:MAG: protein translocase subunit SecD [Coxiellaceae bacterium]|jgi:preprotein translocase subunit SecD|nr:protein translocase subunit SecD [Coxiellaceae bacterium]